MKVIKSKKFLHKMLDLKLINSKISQSSFKKKFKNFKTSIKISFKLVFKYHLLNRKILFFGLSTKLNRFIYKLVKKTKHVYIPNNFWFNGVLTNISAIFKYLIVSKKLSKLVKHFSKLSKINLILLFNVYKNVVEFLFLKAAAIISFSSIKDFCYCDYNIIGLENNTGFSIFSSFFKILKKKSTFLKTKV